MLKVVFMGTPEFAIPALEAVEASGMCKICAIVTQPDRPKGRGKKPLPPPVKEWGQKRGYCIFQPEDASAESFIEAIDSIRPDLIITAAYGQILKRKILDIPLKGCINIHASLLPEYRGASPIQQVLIDGREKTGITIIYMDAGMDTGDKIASRSINIMPDENAGELHDRLANLGGELLREIIPGFVQGKPDAVPQEHDKATYCKKIDKSMGKINWEDCASNIVNLIRGLTPWPGAYTFFDGQRIKVWKASVWEYSTTDEIIPGRVYVADVKRGLVVGCKNSLLRILMLQAQNGKVLKTEEYLIGHKIPEGYTFG